MKKCITFHDVVTPNKFKQLHQRKKESDARKELSDLRKLVIKNINEGQELFEFIGSYETVEQVGKELRPLGFTLETCFGSELLEIKTL